MKKVKQATSKGLEFLNDMKPNLMITRFKVIADYPYSIFNIGDILEIKETKMGNFVVTYTSDDGLHFTGEEVLEKYPNIFYKLKWYQERTLEDMPEYVKLTKDNTMLTRLNLKENQVYPILNKGEFEYNANLAPNASMFWCTIDPKLGLPEAIQFSYRHVNYNHFEPATHQEYLDQINFGGLK